MKGDQIDREGWSVPLKYTRANGLNVYYYLRHLLTELPQLLQSREKLKESVLEPLMPWSKALPEECYSKRRR